MTILFSLKSTTYTQKSAHTPYVNLVGVLTYLYSVLSFSSPTSFLCEEMQLIF